MDIIPAFMRRLWVAWEVRMLVLVSLIIQFMLIILGNRRKYVKSIWIRSAVWLLYLTADSVATVALGTLSDAQVDEFGRPRNKLRLIWAPLLLVHLGGPDTITAYTLEDNQLWLRHFLGLAVQVFLVIYVLLLSWEASWLTFLTLPVFLAGILKYGERTWVLKSSRTAQYSESHHNDVPLKYKTARQSLMDQYGNLKPYFDDVESVVTGHRYLCTFKSHILNHIAERGEINEVHFKLLKPNDDMNDDLIRKYWDAMGVEMGLMYDMLYTKAPINYTKTGFILRTICFSCILTSLVGFLIFLLEKQFHRHVNDRQSFIDFAVTGVLLVGAFLVEIYAVIILLSSDWAVIWLVQHQRYRMVSKFYRLFSVLHQKKRWSNSVGQFNLNNYLKLNRNNRYEASFSSRLDLLGIKEMFDKHRHTECVHIPDEMKKQIFKYLSSGKLMKGILSDPHMGRRLVDYYSICGPNTDTGVLNIAGTDEVVFILYIATEICRRSSSDTNGPYRNSCSLLSKYMLYLVILCPEVLQLIFKDDAFYEFCQTYQDMPDGEHHSGYHLLHYASCVVSYVRHNGKDEEWYNLWILWMDTFSRAALHCPQEKHATQLRNGGELITLCWLITQGRKFLADTELDGLFV